MKQFIQNIANGSRLLAAITLAAIGMMCGAGASAKPGDKLLNRPYADLKRWHLGFSVGAHVQDLSFTHNGYVSPDGQKWVAEVPDFSPGFCVNVSPTCACINTSTCASRRECISETKASK